MVMHAKGSIIQSNILYIIILGPCKVSALLYSLRRHCRQIQAPGPGTVL